MKSKKVISLAGALSLMLLGSAAQAQMFQNNNVACESKAITTETNVQSVRCRYHTGNVDFDLSGYADCVAEDASWSTPGDVDTAILLNNGPGVTCGVGSGQFADSAVYAEDNNIASGTTPIATAIAGPLSPGARSTAFVPFVGGSTSGNLAFDTPNASGVLPATPSYVGGFFGILQNGFSSGLSGYNRTTAMFDCNNDNFQDVVLSGVSSSLSSVSNTLILQVFQNSGGVLSASSQPTILNASSASAPNASLAVGDFNGDGIPDIAAATGNKNGAVDPQVVICTNDGSCGFTCSSVINLVTEHPGFAAAEISGFVSGIAAGDFDGDGVDDIVLGLKGQSATDEFEGLDYYLNQGSNTFSHTFVTVTNSVGNYPQNITTGYFNNDSILDVAGTLFGDSPVVSTVEVVTSNGSGGFNTPLTLNFTTNTSVDLVDSAWGIDAADFDRQGCDDIIALADDPVTSTRGGRAAYIFMNTVETLTVNAGSAETIAGSSVTLNGTCTLNPADTTTTASSIVPAWTVVSGPAGATLTNASTLTPTLNVSNNGTYVLQLSCSSQCVSATTSTVSITVNDRFLEGSGMNGCALNMLAGESSVWTYISVLMSTFGMFVFRRKKS